MWWGAGTEILSAAGAPDTVPTTMVVAVKPLAGTAG